MNDTLKLATEIATERKAEFIEKIVAGEPGSCVLVIDEYGEEHILTRNEFAALPIGPALNRVKALTAIGLSGKYLFVLQRSRKSVAFIELNISEGSFQVRDS